MENEFVQYEQALALKELGFDEMCFGFYSSPVLELMHCKNSEPWMGNAVVAAPLKQQAFRWFRENYDLSYSIIWKMPGDGNGYKSEIQNGREIFDIGLHSKYEEAELKCLKKLIEIVIKK